MSRTLLPGTVGLKLGYGPGPATKERAGVPGVAPQANTGRRPAGPRGVAPPRKYAGEMKLRTAAGPASAKLDAATDPPFLLVLTHGAGGGTDSADLLAARQAGLDQGAAVARVVQPYRLRGARAPGSAVRQDEAWLEISAKLRRRFPGVPLLQGGRSNGARVACRTARQAGAQGVLGLGFPLHPPGRPA